MYKGMGKKRCTQESREKVNELLRYFCFPTPVFIVVETINQAGSRTGAGGWVGKGNKSMGKVISVWVRVIRVWCCPPQGSEDKGNRVTDSEVFCFPTCSRGASKEDCADT